jgi:hypothetical protein
MAASGAQVSAAWSVSHRQPELDLIVSLVELDERTAAINAAGRGLELIEPWPDRPVDLGRLTVQVTAQESPARKAAEVQTELFRVVTAPNRGARGVGPGYEISYCIHLAAAQADEPLEAGPQLLYLSQYIVAGCEHDHLCLPVDSGAGPGEHGHSGSSSLAGDSRVVTLRPPGTITWPPEKNAYLTTHDDDHGCGSPYGKAPRWRTTW